jgi:UDP-N-acetylmuramoyl-L-alanyl-D-glutamate--2,6-diaminopimelate ligase
MEFLLPPGYLDFSGNSLPGSLIVETLQQHGLQVSFDKNFLGININSIATDSRQVNSNAALFCAVSGIKDDGARYIREAIDRGVKAVLITNDSVIEMPPDDVIPRLRISDTRRAISVLAALGSSYATQQQTVVGVTGTNGKTTSAHIMLQLFNLLAIPAASIGTLGLRVNACGGGQTVASSLTTPDPLQIHGWCRDLVRINVRHLVMEVSSHSLHQKRVDDVKFDVGVLTNVTQDHLDYHAGFEDYLEAKYRLFDFSFLKRAVINADDSVGQRFIERLKGRHGMDLLTIGSSKGCDFQIQTTKIINNRQFIELDILGKHYSFYSPLLGRYNVYNLIGILAVCELLGYVRDDYLPLIEKLSQAPGRLEKFETEGRSIYVDYAHTPDAIVNVLTNVRQITKNKVWIVFGCGGNRDRSKRPLMLQAARLLADYVVVTNDNPRLEDPQQIVNDMMSGGLVPDMVECDRKSAILYAIINSQEGDSVVVAGKGHEDYQIIGDQKLPFSDQLVIQEYLNAKCLADYDRGTK